MSFQEEDIKLILIGGSIGLLLLVSLFLALFIVYNRNLQRRQKEAFKNTLDAIEKERQRIGQDLHDDISPLIAGVKMSLEALGTYIGSNDKANELLELQKRDLKLAVNSIRDTTHELSPTGLINDGLISAVRKKAKLINTNPNWQVNVSGDHFPKGTSTSNVISIYRILNELIHNSIKHSKGNIININFSTDEENAYINYADNGQGLSLDETTKLGLGLSGLKTRVGLMNGEIAFNEVEIPGFNVVMKYKITKL